MSQTTPSYIYIASEFDSTYMTGQCGIGCYLTTDTGPYSTFKTVEITGKWFEIVSSTGTACRRITTLTVRFPTP